jgi:FtsP/CotA-like multicopper oxidase with cupredoxin domain
LPSPRRKPRAAEPTAETSIPMIRPRPLLMALAIVAGLVPLGATQHPHHLAATDPKPAGTLPGPAVLENLSKATRTVEVSLTAAPERLALVPGSPSLVYAYNGRVPGPTLDIREGDRVIVHFRNRLPEPTTIHWHGLHIPASSDGSPFAPVAPGASRDYIFTMKPGSAGTYWYHPHAHGTTGVQIGRGLYGALIVRAEKDPLPPLTEQVLLLTDNRLAADGRLDFPDPHSAAGQRDEVNGREGDLLFVNGDIKPTLRIRAGEVQRWRIINASAARVYRLAIPGMTLLHVGSDGGLFEVPRELHELVVANSERVEILIRGTDVPGTTRVLQALPYDRYVPQTRPADWNVPRDLLTLQYTDAAPVSPVTLPTRLREVPAIDASKSVATRVISFSQGLINGRTMDIRRVDLRARLGTTEIWDIENLVGMDHPFHLHGFQFQVLDRNGVPEPYRSWKDSVNVPKHETVRIVVTFADYPGKWMFHCHILDHEDRGMMGVLVVG